MTAHKTLLALAIGLLVAMPAAAGQKAALPKDLPPFAPDKPLPVPQIAKKRLANGLEIWVVQRNGIPRVDYALAFRDAGLGADAAGQDGFAGLLSALLTEGTAQHDSRALAEAAQALGGGVGAAASNDGLTVVANALADNARPMMQLLAEVARTPTFPEDEVALAKANALQAIKAAEAQPGYKANKALMAAIYGEHPYARTQQTPASVAALDAATLRREHARRFRPDRALLVVAGRIAPAEAFKLAEAAFGDWTNNGAPVPQVAAARRSVPASHVLIQRDGSVQSTLRLGSPAIPATDPDYVPLQLAGTILGGGFSSRLMQNLREEKGYTYGAGGGQIASRMGGRVQAQADVRNEVTGAAIKEFLHEFQRIGSEPVSAQELDETKRYVAGGYLISNQLQGAVAGTLANNWLLGLPAEFLGRYVPGIRAVSAEQVQAMGRKYFDPARQSIVVVGDAKAVAEQLKAYGEFKAPAP